MENLTAIIEAILFVSGDPVRVDALAHAMNLTVSELNEALAELGDHLALENRGIQLNRSGETVFLSICPKYARQVEDFLQPLQKQPLSQAVLETLSIIAYRQPVTKGDIEAVRGVKCDYSVQSLLNKGFIEEQGRRETLGHVLHLPKGAQIAQKGSRLLFGVDPGERLVQSIEPAFPKVPGHPIILRSCYDLVRYHISVLKSSIFYGHCVHYGLLFA